MHSEFNSGALRFTHSLSPLYIFSPTHSSLQVLEYTEHEHKRMQQAIRVRQASVPGDLILRVKEIEEAALRENMMEKLLQSMREKLKDEVLRVLKELNADSNSTAQQDIPQCYKSDTLIVVGDLKPG